jgi:hypothetical protein
MTASSSLLRSVPLVTMLLASLVASGCASAPEPAGQDEPSDEGEAVSTEEEIRASCSSPRRYFVTFREGSGTCTAIPARRGQWLPEKLFSDAPADVQSSTCAYRWSGLRYSRPDREAIEARVGIENGLAPACGSSSEPDVGLLQPIPQLDIVGQAGSVGCDVCGVLRNRRIWVILPPERVASRQFAVQLSNGESRAFQIEATDARALSIALPPPPAGTRYKQGRVHMY